MKKYIIKVNGVSYEVEVEEVGGAVKTEAVKPAAVKASAPASAPISTPTPQPKQSNIASVEGAVNITAPMPGTILKVNVNNGDMVKRGDTLLILEAMKMENEITAPSDGRVVALNVAEGATVSVGEVLVSLM